MNSNSGDIESCQACEFQENLDILRQIPFFSPLPLDKLKVLAYLCSQERFKKGDFIFKQDEDDGQGIYIISGSANMVRKDPDKERVVREFGAGDFLGRLSLFGKSNRLFSLIATSDTACLVVPREKFAKAMAQFPELMPKVLQSLVEKIHMWEKRRMIDYPDIYDKPCGHIGVSLL